MTAHCANCRFWHPAGLYAMLDPAAYPPNPDGPKYRRETATFIGGPDGWLTTHWVQLGHCQPPELAPGGLTAGDWVCSWHESVEEGDP